MLSSPLISIYNFWKKIIFFIGIPLCLILLTGCIQENGSNSRTAYVFQIDTTRTADAETDTNQMRLQFDGNNVTIDRGDGAVNRINEEGPHAIIHTYETPDVYTISMDGNFEYVRDTFYEVESDTAKIIDVLQRGTRKWQSMTNMYKYSGLTTFSAQDIPDTSAVKDMSAMFYKAVRFNDTSIGNRNTASVENMNDIFREAMLFNGNISGWDVNNVKKMNSSFNNATNFNGNVSQRNTESLISMRETFRGAKSFNQDLGHRNVAKVKNMGYLFADASSFNQNIGDRTINNLIIGDGMFENAGLTTNNYDKLLIGRSIGSPPTDIKFDAGYSVYCDTVAIAARKKLTEEYNREISDGGQCDID